MKMEKMVRTAKTLDKVFKILQWVGMICAAVTALVLGIVTVMNAIDPDSFIGTAFHAVDIGPLTFQLAEEAAPDSSTILRYIWILAAAAIAFVAILCYVLGILRRILKPMTQGRPFAPFVSKEIRRLAFASLAVGVIYNVMSALETWGAIRFLDLTSLLQNSQIRSVTANFSCDVTFVIAFLVLLLVSYIFQYGEELQKESDETL